MSDQQATSTTELEFTDGELDALRGMVTDWINERIAQPPLPPDFNAVIQKLGISL